MKTKRNILIILITALIVSAIVACGIMFINKEAHVANLNNYVVITEHGGNGCGSISLSIDFDEFIRDYSHRLTDENLEELGMADMTPDQAAKHIIDNDNPHLLGYVVSNTLKNDDAVELTWKVNTEAIEKLAKVLEVEIEYSNFTYTMQSLRDVKTVDIFDNVRFQCWGSNGEGTVSPFADAFVTIEETGEVISFMVNVEASNDGNLSNGDTVHVSLNGNVNFDHLAETYGIVIERTEADVVIGGFSE